MWPRGLELLLMKHATWPPRYPKYGGQNPFCLSVSSHPRDSSSVPWGLGLHEPILPTTIRPKTILSVTFGDLNRITDFRRRRLTSFVGIKRYEGYLLRGCVMRDTCYEDGNTKFQSQWIHVSPIHVWWGEVNICMWIFGGDVWLWVVNQINDFVQERSKRSR